MLYLLKVNILIASLVFSGAGLILLTMLAWQQARAFVAARHSIQKRLATIVTQPQFFANTFAISRRFSRTNHRSHVTVHSIQ